MSSITFHIIYLPGTVQQLRFLVQSLLKWSAQCVFRLVTNGCSATEVRSLQALCTRDSRLTTAVLPTTKPMLHGEALNYLQAQTQDDYFCFMDSDIYAVDSFMPAFRPRLAQYSGIFSGIPIRYPQGGQTLPPGVDFWAGPYSHSVWHRHARAHRKHAHLSNWGTAVFL